MTSYQQDERETRILFGAVFLGVPALFLFVRLLPLVLFYVLPFALMSGLVALLWMGLSHLAKEDFSWLGLIIPGTAVALFLLVGFPEATKIVAGQLVPNGTYFLDLYNDWNQAILGFLWRMTPTPFDPFFGLKPRANLALYDWNTVRWLLWTALGIGAPAIFSVWSHRRRRVLRERYEAAANEKLALQAKDFEARKARARARFDALIFEKKNAEQEVRALNAEVTKLKALLDFQKKASAQEPPPEKEGKTSGVLDSDAL